MQKVLQLGILATIALFICALWLANSPQILQLEMSVQSLSPKLTFFLIADYGYEGLVEQKAVAAKMDEIAAINKPKFIIGAGDNFYNPDGVTGVNDPVWQTHWVQIYKILPNLRDLPWYGTMGNHDYNSPNIFAEFQYKQFGWRLNGFFYEHTHLLQPTAPEKAPVSVSFVHVDTTFLAYGPNGQEGGSKPLMKGWFDRLGWKSDEQMVQMADDVMKLDSDSEWLLMVGHHPIKYNCEVMRNCGYLMQLVEKYKVSAYLHGHVHNLASTYRDNVAHLMSGAAASSYRKCDTSQQSDFFKDLAYGFLSITIDADDDTLQGTFYYTEDKDLKAWETYTTVKYPRRTTL